MRMRSNKERTRIEAASSVCVTQPNITIYIDHGVLEERGTERGFETFSTHPFSDAIRQFWASQIPEK